MKKEAHVRNIHKVFDAPKPALSPAAFKAALHVRRAALLAAQHARRAAEGGCDAAELGSGRGSQPACPPPRGDGHDGSDVQSPATDGAEPMDCSDEAAERPRGGEARAEAGGAVGQAVPVAGSGVEAGVGSAEKGKDPSTSATQAAEAEAALRKVQREERQAQRAAQAQEERLRAVRPAWAGTPSPEMLYDSPQQGLCHIRALDIAW